MSQIDQEQILSEDQVSQSDILGDSSRLVPVTESIRYRKRAQSAEKQAQELLEQLNQTKSHAEELENQLSDIKTEQKLTSKLASAGVVDLEAAVLIAKSRMTGSNGGDIESIVEKLKKEKQYLFSRKDDSAVTAAKRTTPAKDRVVNNPSVLERAAKRAASTGNRVDLQEYLKLRRNHL